MNTLEWISPKDTCGRALISRDYGVAFDRSLASYTSQIIYILLGVFVCKNDSVETEFEAQETRAFVLSNVQEIESSFRKGNVYVRVTCTCER